MPRLFAALFMVLAVALSLTPKSSRAATSVGDQHGVFRYQELQFDEAGFPRSMRVVFDIPAKVDVHPGIVTVTRAHAPSNTPSEWREFGCPINPQHIRPDGMAQWAMGIDINKDIWPVHMGARDRTHWCMPLSSSEDTLFPLNQGFVPLLLLDGVVTGVRISHSLPNDLFAAWVEGKEWPPPFALPQSEVGSDAGVQRNADSPERRTDADGVDIDSPPTSAPEGELHGHSSSGADRLRLRKIEFRMDGRPRRFEGCLHLKDRPNLSPCFVAVYCDECSFYWVGS